jgi:ABC-type polysaccharide/polyol phosphate export permease
MRARPPLRQRGNALVSCKRSIRLPGIRGLRDLWQGWRDYRELWVTVGLYDIRKRYRRSLLGPFWITISLGAFILGLSFIY